MPAIQVLDRQVDPSAQLALETSKSIEESMQRKQAMQLAVQEFKLKAKATDNETQKMELEKQSALTDFAFKLNDSGITDPAMKLKAIHNYGEALGLSHQDTIKTLAQAGQSADDYMSVVANAPTPQQRLQTNMNTLNGMGGAPVAQPDSSGQPALPSAPANVQARANAVSGEAPTSGYIPGDAAMDLQTGKITMPMINLDAERAKAQAVASGTELAKKNIAHQQFTRDFEDFKALNDQLPRSEKGGVMDIASKGISMMGKAMDQNTPEGQLIAAYDGAAKRFTTTLARQVDVGNLSQTEQDAAAKMVPTKFDSKGTSNIKMAFIEDMNRAIGSGDRSKLKQIITQYQNTLKAHQQVGVDNPRKKAVGDAAPKPAGPVEGQTYVDAQGNKAVYKNGQYVETP